MKQQNTSEGKYGLLKSSRMRKICLYNQVLKLNAQYGIYLDKKECTKTKNDSF
jgi:hypothetical protein